LGKGRKQYGKRIRLNKSWNRRVYGLAKSAKEEIGKIKGVKEVYFVFGRYDLVAHMEAPTLEELARIISDKIRGVAGVRSTETLIIGF
jgi:DNA-binding Lrp family transcriptional regulator